MLGLFFSTFLLITHKKYRPANFYLAIYLIAFSIRIGKSLFHNYVHVDATLRTFLLTTLLAVGPSIWLYIKYSMLNTDIKKTEQLHFIPLLLFLLVAYKIPNDGSPIFGVYYNFLTLHIAVYTFYAVFWIWRQKKGEVKEQRTLLAWLNMFLIMNVIFLVGYFLISESIIPFYIGISMLFSVVVIVCAFAALLNPSLFVKPLEKYKNSRLGNRNVQEIMEQLKQYMKDEKPYLDTSFSLTSLSKKLALTPNDISRSINELESMNFSQWVAWYRVQEVQELMKSPRHQHLKIAALAYESGFSSISTFNAAFKKHVDMTPKNYRLSKEKG